MTRTKVQGVPAQVDSPWIEWKISVIRKEGAATAPMPAGLEIRQSPCHARAPEILGESRIRVWLVPTVNRFIQQIFHP